MLANQLQRVFQHRHHSQSQQIHFDDPHVRAIFFVPLHHHAPGHRRWLQRHHHIQLPLAYHHAAGVLPQMSRQILYLQAQFKEFPDFGMPDIEACIMKMPFKRVVLIFVFPSAYQTGESRQRFRIER